MTYPGPCGFTVKKIEGLADIRACVPGLQQLACSSGQAGFMHGIELLLSIQFSRRKRPCLLCFYRQPAPGQPGITVLLGAVLLAEYTALGLRTGLYATLDNFGVRTVVGPAHLHMTFCVLAGRLLLSQGARLALMTWQSLPGELPATAPANGVKGGPLYALSIRSVQDTLPLQRTAQDTMQTLGKRTRVHMRAARRHFDKQYPEARLLNAAADLASSSDAQLKLLNEGSLDVIDQASFNHQVRSVAREPDGFVLGLWLHSRWIALIGGWRQGSRTWIEWQCNSRGFEKLSLGSVLRTYLFEEESRRGSHQLSFHGGTSHSMLHSFQHTPVADLLVRRPGPVSDLLVRLVPWICERRPQMLQRGNFLWNALCTPGLQWSSIPPLGAAGPQDAPAAVPTDILSHGTQC